MDILHPFRIFRSWFKGRRVYRPITVRFEQPDAQKIRRELDLKAEGERRGKENLPSSDEVRLDEVEQRIVSAIETLKTASYETYMENREAYAATLRAMVSRPLQAAVLIAPSDARAEFERAVREGRDELYSIQNFVVDVSKEFENFRNKHHIDRTPDYPDSRFLHWGVIALLILIEAGANTFFFAQGTDFGIVGGFVLAVLAAAANVLIGLGVGYQPFRWKTSRSWGLKTLGYALTILYIPLMLVLNLGVAHYRTALVLSTDSSAAFQIAVHRLSRTPLQIGSFESLMLLIVGIFFSLIAFADGYHLDDPYPGYGRLARRREACLEQFRDAKADFIDSLKDSKDAMLQEVQENSTIVERRRLDFGEVREKLESLEKQFKQYLDLLEQVGNEVLKTYREANQNARTTPRPAHFTDLWAMLRPDLGDGTIVDTDAFEKESELTVQKLAAGGENIIRFFEEAVKSFETIQDLTQEEEQSSHLRPDSSLDGWDRQQQSK
jgi:hypothetical protein